MEYFKRLGNFWFPDWMALAWLLFALPALYFFQTTIHEGTHAMAALFVTGSFPKVAPFPHLASDAPRPGMEPRTYFLNGVTLGDSSTRVSKITRTDCDSPARSRTMPLAGFPAMPQFLALGLIVIFTVVFVITTVANPLVRFGIRVWYLGACIDFMYASARGLIGGCNEKADWSKFLLQSDMPTGLFAFLTWLFWLGILSHFLWVYWSRWGRDAVAETGFWDYRWIALILGILSFFGVLLAAVINDDAIHKDNAAFIVPLVFQVIAFCWYWIYFGLTFKYKD